ncbi:hypothetical protein [Palleronia sp. LCG004]|uniref:hypothetical protein n=1 Tax=Palleronia sp. LCG004 TaxID=3079304 RepID=UPI002941DD0A|nr:hypothetical protein [Palleronia sp. LCG004]WOI58069.1 hypothetical protein RVY76_17135 [Palleronia sp. LCG004]
MNRIVPIAIAAFALASPAVAANQLARSVGVDDGAYTTNELIVLRRAQEENDDLRLKLITDHTVISTKNASSNTQSQLAKSLGVEGGKYTTNELIELRRARQENDEELENFITEANAGTTQGVERAERAQLADALGLNAEDYTRSELARLYFAAYSDND